MGSLFDFLMASILCFHKYELRRTKLALPMKFNKTGTGRFWVTATMTYVKMTQEEADDMGCLLKPGTVNWIPVEREKMVVCVYRPCPFSQPPWHHSTFLRFGESASGSHHTRAPICWAGWQENHKLTLRHHHLHRPTASHGALQLDKSGGTQLPFSGSKPTETSVDVNVKHNEPAVAQIPCPVYKRVFSR